MDVPLTATEFEQYKARVDRANSHEGLPLDERVVNVRVACSSLPSPLKSYIGSLFWRRFATQGTGASPPAFWEKQLNKVKKAVAVIKHELGVDPDDSDCLHELRDCMKDEEMDDSVALIGSDWTAATMVDFVQAKARRCPRSLAFRRIPFGVFTSGQNDRSIDMPDPGEKMLSGGNRAWAP